MDELPQETKGSQESGPNHFRGDGVVGHDKKRKRDNTRKDHYFTTYENVTYERIVEEEQEIIIPGTDNLPAYKIHATTPGTFSRYFAHSYRAKFTASTTGEDYYCSEEQRQESQETPKGAPQQIIHQHVNGLCVITIGNGGILSATNTKHTNEDDGDDDSPNVVVSSVERIEFLVTASERCSAGERRKRNSKMLKKGTANTVKSIQNKNQNKNNHNDNNKQHGTDDADPATSTMSTSTGIVKPDTMIAKMHLNNGTFLPIYACVWGSILELNTHVTPKQLLEEPLLEGYLAVILPTGPFPPKERLIHNAAGVVATAAGEADHFEE